MIFLGLLGCGHQVLGLGVPVRKIPEILKEAADELKRLQAAGSAERALRNPLVLEDSPSYNFSVWRSTMNYMHV